MVSKDKYLSEVFPEPPLVAYTWPINIEVPKIKYKSFKRSLKGMKNYKQNSVLYAYS